MAEPEASSLNTAEYFGRLAVTYGAGEYYRKRREAALTEIRVRLGNIESLLDLGCGNGTYLAAFAHSLDPPILVGADLSLPMLREARQRGATTLLMSCDATALPCRTASFRTIFCSHVLQFVNDLSDCLSEIARCLVPDGNLVIAGGELGTRERLGAIIGDEEWARLRSTLPRPRDVHVRRHLADYQTAAETAGLIVDACKAGFVARFADITEFYRVRWLPLLDHSSQDSLNRLLNRLTQQRGSEEIQLSESLLFCRKPA